MERGAALLGIQVARSLHARWRRLSAVGRRPGEQIAQEVKDLALDLRGEPDTAEAEIRLYRASERLAEAIVESVEADPEVEAPEVEKLRDELARELSRLSSAP